MSDTLRNANPGKRRRLPTGSAHNPISYPAAMATSPSSPSSPPPSPQKRASRVVFDFPYEYLARFFHLPQRTAAMLMNVSPITLKRNCKRLGIRWPYRSEKERRQREQRDKQGGRRRRAKPQTVEPSIALLRFTMLPIACMDIRFCATRGWPAARKDKVDLAVQPMLALSLAQ